MDTPKHDIIYWLWLSLCCSPGSSAGELLLEYFEDDVQKIYEVEDPSTLPSSTKISPETITRLMNKDLGEAEHIKLWCEQNNIGLLPANSPLYSKRLARIQTKPILLYYRGKLPVIDENVLVAAVGTRRMSEYGQRQAYLFSHDMARGGAIVVSGLALGVDAICHRACLDAGGHTIGVIGCGIDRVYPSENLELMEEIAVKGTIITEFKPGTPPNSVNFPIRNRLMSGISNGTVVIEADGRSGALITARTAIKQGRDVFALPGKVGEANSQGTNKLIKDGAKPITCAEDILEEYQFLFPNKIFLENLKFGRAKGVPSNTRGMKVAADSYGAQRRTRDAAKKENDTLPSLAPAAKQETPAKQTAPVEKIAPKKQTAPTKSVDATPPPPPNKQEIPDEKRTKAVAGLVGINKQVYEALSVPATPDELAAGGIAINTVMASLTILEIKGLVKPLPGGRYERK
ncbi:MAG: DNA-processing protein DprA [Oscillospiraceae bacterium]|nr:DNA-processing protein DprA [Oscillospiraceae bacterium]